MFRYRRVGAGGVAFDYLKFRTVVDAKKAPNRLLAHDVNRARQWISECFT